MPALTPAQLRDPAIRRMLARALGVPQSLSPALEGDLAAFGPPADFAGAFQRVGEVEQGGAALPFAVGDQLLAPRAQGFGFGDVLGGAFGWMTPGTIAALGLEKRSLFHGEKMRAWIAERQCETVPESHRTTRVEIVR